MDKPLNYAPKVTDALTAIHNLLSDIHARDWSGQLEHLRAIIKALEANCPK